MGRKGRNNPAELSPEEIAARDEAKKKRHRKRVRAFRSGILHLFSLALVLYVLFFHLVGITVMSSGDMYPRIDAGDLILFYRLDKDPKAQDVIVLDKAVRSDLSAAGQDDPPASGGIISPELWGKFPDWLRDALLFLKFKDPTAPQTTRFVCRVVAVGGDTVEITETGRLVINGNSMIETGIFYSTTEYVGFTEYPLTLAPGECFVLADFRNGGADSRFFGPVKQSEIQGAVITVMRRSNI